MIIAIDHGNYAIKTVNHSFIAGVSEHTVKPPIADEILEYDGKYWTLTGNRLSYMRDKTQDERYFILTLFAVAKELEKAGSFSPFEQIDLAVGLPPEHYGALKNNEIQNLIFLVGFLTEIRPNFLKSFCLTTKLPKDESLLLYEDILLYLDN